MRYVKLIILAVLALMSLAAGLAKAMQVPQEAAFFEAVGVNLNLLIPFGIVQIIGGALGAMPMTRRLGLSVMALAFLASAIMIFMSGNMTFGAISLVPAVLAGWLGYRNV